MRWLGYLITAVVVAVGGYWLWRETRPELPACVPGLWLGSDGQKYALVWRPNRDLRVTSSKGDYWSFSEEQPGRYRGGPGLNTPAGDRATLTISKISCPAAILTVRGALGQDLRLAKQALDLRDVQFKSGDLNLKGRLILPGAASASKAVVLVHGSDRASALQSQYLQYMLPAYGIAVFVYDKRGTGASEGQFAQDFYALAQDAGAALTAARKILADDNVEIGFLGTSQGGWVAPLAASQTSDSEKPGFVAVAYGLPYSALDEDRFEVMYELERKNLLNDETRAAAAEITSVTGKIMQANFKNGCGELDRIYAKYGQRPWYKEIQTGFTGDFLGLPTWFLCAIGPWLDEGTSWAYEPRPTIEGLKMRQLWLLARDDSEAPSAPAAEILAQIQIGGSRLDYAVVEGADHAFLTFTTIHGERVHTGVAPQFLDQLTHWILSGSLKEGTGIAIRPHPRN